MNKFFNMSYKKFCPALGPAYFLIAILAVCLLPSLGYAQTQQCVSDPQFANVNTGPAIVTSIFGDGTSANPGVINSVLNSVSAAFYNSIIANPQFKGIVGGLLVLYVAIYGVMIMFNLIHIGTYDLVGRAFKVGVVYAMVFPIAGYTSGWAFFYDWIGGFFMGGMNLIITQFSQAGVTNLGATPVVFQPGVTVNPGVMQALIGPIGQVFSAKFVTVIMALFSAKEVGPMMAFFMIWALIDFIFMVIGAMATYLKSVVGLAFLFGIAPIFVLFLMFDKSRQVFVGWINQVVAFTITPILLFAFLAFYCQLISGIITGMLYLPPTSSSLATDYCWAPWFSIPGLWDFWWWMPKYTNASGGAGVTTPTAGGDCVINGLSCVPLQMVDILYFLLLCHLGKEFCKYIDTIAQDISNATGPGIVQGGQIASWVQNSFSGIPGMSRFGPSALGAGVLTAAGVVADRAGLLRPTGNAGQIRPGNLYNPPSTATPAQRAAAERTITGIRPALGSYMTSHLKDPTSNQSKHYTDTADAADRNIQVALTKADASGTTLLDKYTAAPDGSVDKEKAANDIRAAMRSGIQDAASSQQFTMKREEIDAMVDDVGGTIGLPPKKKT